MYNIKNSFKNIMRNKSKYLILAILVFIISFVAIISLIINTSTKDVIAGYYDKYGSTATIEFDPSKMGESMGSNDFTPLTYDQLAKFADSSYVKDVVYTQTVGFEETTLDFNNPDAPQFGMSSGESGGAAPMEISQELSLIGSDNLSKVDNFATETYQIVSGEMPKDNEVLIDQSVAKTNSLKVGDTITLTINDKEVKLKISGLYASTETRRGPFSGRTLYTTYKTVGNIVNSKEGIDAIYELNSYTDVENFQKELYSKGLSTTMYVNNNKQVLNNLTSPLESLQKVSTIFLILVVIFGGAIIIFVTFLMIKERKYEIGVLRAIGSSKRKVITMLFVEMVVVVLSVSLISGAIGIVSSSRISQVMSNGIVSTTTTEEFGGPGSGGALGGGPQDLENEEKAKSLANLDIKLNVMVLVEFVLLWIGLVGIATIFAAMTINKHSPNEILRRRD